MSDDWKIPDDETPTPYPDLLSIHNAMKQLMQSYAKLEHQIIELAQIIHKVPALEEKYANINATIRKIIIDSITDVAGKHLTNIMADSLTTMINSEPMVSLVSKICLRSNEQIYTNQYTIVDRLNNMTTELETLTQRVERLERS